MIKKRLLVTISFSFSIRYLYRTGLLHKLREFAEPVIAITWNQRDLIEELEKDGFEVYLIPESKWNDNYNELRSRIDKWFHNFQGKTPSNKIQKRYLRQFDTPKKKMAENCTGKI